MSQTRRKLLTRTLRWSSRLKRESTRKLTTIYLSMLYLIYGTSRMMTSILVAVMMVRVKYHVIKRLFLNWVGSFDSR